METPWYRPAGPFRPLRRLLFWFVILGFIAAVFSVPVTGTVVWAYLLGSAVWFAAVGLGLLWAVDIVLVYLKAEPDASDDTPPLA